MSDVLSQAEIDALLAALAAGDTIEEENNNQPDIENNSPNIILENSIKLSEKDMEILEYVHKEYAEIISTNMFKNINTKMSLESLQEISYKEFKNSLPCPTVLSAFKLPPLNGYLLFETTPDLMYQIADKIFNKQNSEVADLVKFSEVDKDTFMKIIKNFIEFLEKAWSKVLKIGTQVEDIVTDPSRVNLFDDNESVVLLSFLLNFEGRKAFLNICIPYSSIEEYSGKLEINTTTAQEQINTVISPLKVNNSISQLNLNNSFESTNLNIKVLLDTVQLTLREIKNLKKGSIINTHRVLKNKVSVLIEEKHCFNGEVGLIRNRKAVKIIDCLEKDV